MRLSVRVLSVGWRAPLAAAHAVDGDATGRPLVLIELTADDGIVGHGEAAPLSSYDGVAVPRVLDALHRYVRVLGVNRGIGHRDALEACWAADPLPQALAAIDLALWDIAGRRAGAPVWRLLGAEAARPLPVNAVIGAVSPDQAAGEARAVAAAGFGTVKVKVGVGDDRARLEAVRAAVGDRVALRVDANGAWRTPAEALGALGGLADVGLELCEEPVHGAAALAAVSAASPVAIAVDESTREPAVFGERVAAALCLKIGSCGGITGLLADAHRGRELGYEVFLASTLDGPLGIAAGLAAATALAPERASGLSTLERLEPPPPFSAQDGKLSAPAGVGLGEGLLGWYDAG